MGHCISRYLDEIDSSLHPHCGNSSVFPRFLRLSGLEVGMHLLVNLSWVPASARVAILSPLPAWFLFVSWQLYSFISKSTSSPPHHRAFVFVSGFIGGLGWEIYWWPRGNLQSGSDYSKLDNRPGVLRRHRLATVSTALAPAFYCLTFLFLSSFSSSFFLCPLLSLSSSSQKYKLNLSQFLLQGNSSNLLPRVFILAPGLLLGALWVGSAFWEVLMREAGLLLPRRSYKGGVSFLLPQELELNDLT